MDSPARAEIRRTLDGGGGRSFQERRQTFQAGVLGALTKNHVPIDLVIGTSIGAVNGLVVACGSDPVGHIRRIEARGVIRLCFVGDDGKVVILYVDRARRVAQRLERLWKLREIKMPPC